MVGARLALALVLPLPEVAINFLRECPGQPMQKLDAHPGKRLDLASHEKCATLPNESSQWGLRASL